MPEGKARPSKRAVQPPPGKKEFLHVTDSWLEACMDYSTTAARIIKNRSCVHDYLLPLEATTPTLDTQGRFVLKIEGKDYLPTLHAWQHIGGFVGCAKYDCEVHSGHRKDANGRKRGDSIDQEALLSLVKAGLRFMDPHKRWLFRTQADGTLRAWLSTQYKVIDNLTFIEMIEKAIPGGKISHWKQDDDHSTLWANILLPESLREKGDTTYGAMFSVGNSEIGRRKMGIRPSLFRAISNTGCIWSQAQTEVFDQTHRGQISPSVVSMSIKRHADDQIPSIGRRIDRLLETTAIGWNGTNARSIFAALGSKFRLPASANTQIMDNWREEATAVPEFQRTAFAVINAVTRTGRDERDPSRWVFYEELGGKLLGWGKNAWTDLFRQTKNMKAKDINKAFDSAS